MKNAPVIDRSLTLNIVADWGQANFHRIASWLTQEFCDRAGPQSRTKIWSIRNGGIEAMYHVHDGEAQVCIVTPAMMMAAALEGKAVFEGRPMPGMRALARMPQNDTMMMAFDPKLEINNFADLRAKKPALKLAVSEDDGTSFIGYATTKFMEAHGISKQIIESWGGELIETVRPEQSLELVRTGEANAVIQEAAMAPWWTTIVEAGQVRPINAEPEALAKLEKELGWGQNVIRAGFWAGLDEPIKSLDFSDFLILVRDDMPDDVAHLLAWCLCETSQNIEQTYHHIPAERSPLGYPLDPKKLANTPIDLHPGALAYYKSAGHI